MEDNTGSRESKKKSMEDNTRSSESKEKRRKSMEDNTRSSESKEKKRKSMEDNNRPTENESEEDILDEGDEEAGEEHNQELEVLVQPELAVNKAPEVSSAPKKKNESEEDILHEGDEEADEEHDQEPKENESEEDIFDEGDEEVDEKHDQEPEENESEEDIFYEGNEETDEEHDQEPKVLVQLEPALNKAPEVSLAPNKGFVGWCDGVLCSLVCLWTDGGSSFADRKTRVLQKTLESFGGRVPSSANETLNIGTGHLPSSGLLNRHVGATTSSQSVPGQNIVLVRPRTLGQTNPKEHSGPVPMEGDEEIFEEKAVCKHCFHKLKEENILKTECKCSKALIHEECVAKWSRTRGNNNCDNCEQEVQTFPVTLVRGLSSSTQVVGREKSKKLSLFSRLMRKA